MSSDRLKGPIAEFGVHNLAGQSNEQLFVIHAGLVDRDGEQLIKNVSLVHMAPPLEIAGHMAVDVRGAFSLNDEEKQRLRVFISRHSREHRAYRSLRGVSLYKRFEDMYCIVPHSMLIKERGVELHTRFSCAGFVYEAYESARLNLLDLNALPYIDLPILKQSYPRFADQIESPDFRASLGLQGDGPWPVMLCGYLFHALNRSDEEIRSNPYRPEVTDAYFP